MLLLLTGEPYKSDLHMLDFRPEFSWTGLVYDSTFSTSVQNVLKEHNLLRTVACCKTSLSPEVVPKIRWSKTYLIAFLKEFVVASTKCVNENWKTTAASFYPNSRINRGSTCEKNRALHHEYLAFPRKTIIFISLPIRGWNWYIPSFLGWMGLFMLHSFIKMPYS